MTLLGATRGDGSVSFYFFDIDDNLLFLPTKIYVTDTETGAEKGLSTGAFADVEGLLGKPGRWEAWTLGPGAFRDFSDTPGAAPCDSAFVRDIRAALGGQGWRGPSWPLYLHACAEGRPTAFITARGHAPETIRAGLAALAEAGVAPCAPDVLAIYPVGEANTRRLLGGDAHTTTPVLKRRAILQAVAAGLAAHGAAPPHRFGMSDDDPRNVSLIVAAMRDAKARHPDKRFFAIDTNRADHVKLEVFAMDYPATKPG